MNRYLLDTSALLTLRDDEAGAQQVADLLYQAQHGSVECMACFMTQMELLYRVWCDEGKQVAHLALEQARSLPISWIHEEQALLEKAAELKAMHPISLADAWIAACALLQDAALVHKDPEFEAVDCSQIKLPYK